MNVPTSKPLSRSVSIRGRKVSDADPIFIVGEIACGHQGDVGKTKALIDAAAAAGADAVQLEYFYPPANVVPTLPFYKLVEDLSFTQPQWAELMAHARTHDIAVSAFVYDDVGLEWALGMNPDMLKLNSSDISNPDLIIGAAKSGLPFTVGTGASTFDEIGGALELALSHGNPNVILQHGVQNFPTPSDEAHVRRIALLKAEFGALIMYADHTDASLPLARCLDLTAVGMGACMLEKHMVLSRADQGVDWQAALEPAELKDYVATMRAGWRALGPAQVQPLTASDQKYRRFQKKSVVAVKAIPAGSKITRAQVAFLRAQGDEAGMSPMKFGEIEGRTAARDIQQWAQITPADLS